MRKDTKDIQTLGVSFFLLLNTDVTHSSFRKLPMDKVEKALWIKETTNWHKMLQPADAEGTAVWFTFSHRCRVVFYYGLE